MLSGFKDFIQRGNVVDMAVGIVIGAAFGAIVSSFVDDVLMPPVGLLLGGINFEDAFFVLKEGDLAGPYATLAAAKSVGAVTLNWGLLVNSIIKFLIVAFAVYMVVRALAKAQGEVEGEEAGPTSEELLTEIRDLLKK